MYPPSPVLLSSLPSSGTELGLDLELLTPVHAFPSSADCGEGPGGWGSCPPHNGLCPPLGFSLPPTFLSKGDS